MLTSKSPSNPTVMQSFLSLTGPLHSHPKIARHLVINGEMSYKRGENTWEKEDRADGGTDVESEARTGSGVTKNTS